MLDTRPAQAARRARGPEAVLVLEDGSAFRGTAFGAEGESFGEAVFNTGMAGYQEVLTDPSYAGQIVAMTYPHQGNYGVNRDDPESSAIQVAGFAVREAFSAHIGENASSAEGSEANRPPAPAIPLPQTLLALLAAAFVAAHWATGLQDVW